ncbi:glycoside hydrolase family 31 protein [Auriscalpium vulgare]|uniref:Glycoside hydrolase family 31 protein n=1 Tax=Auriscalpium vulgare TaxID=40419 RepID=A0ACB8RS97_9AGAM|nr:glycoside hydrolase family 31 protein [Auriscalpium vulgare]
MWPAWLSARLLSQSPVTLTNADVSSLASSRPSLAYDLGHGFSLTWSANPSQLVITGNNDTIFASNGNFNMTEVNVDICQKQTVTEIGTSHGSDTPSVTVKGDLLECGNSTATTKYTLSFGVPPGFQDRVAFQLEVFRASNSPTANTSQPLTKIYLTHESHASEDFYGFGAQASFASLKNQTVHILSREQGVGRGDQPATSTADAAADFAGGNAFTTYTAIPQYITTDARVVYLLEQYIAYASFDLSSPHAVRVRYGGRAVGGHVTRGTDVLDAGAVLGIQGGQDKVMRFVEQGLENGVDCPIAAVRLQDWTGTHFQEARYNDPDLYPDWTTFVQTLRSKHDVHTLSYVNTFLADTGTKPDKPKRNLVLEASKLSYLIRNSTTNSTLIVSSGADMTADFLDVTNEKTRDWFASVLQYTPVTLDVSLYNAANALTYHNQYPRDWAQLQHNIVTDLNKASDAVVFHRSAAFLSNRYMNLFWAGDHNTNWGRNDGIQSVVPVMVHMGFSGFPQQHGDIGGYTNVLTPAPPDGNVTRSAELLGRWGELAAVSSAVFRSHEGSIPSCAAYGWPLLRAPVVYHTADQRSRRVVHESFYLADLYVAPVVAPGMPRLSVYLPGGENEVYAGGQHVEVRAPYGQPAIFVVNNATSDELECLWDL